MTNPPRNKIMMSFSVQRQLQSNWCWAAVAASIADYYDPNTTETQCTIANRCLKRTDCSTTVGRCAPNSACNQPHWLSNDDGAVWILGLQKSSYARQLSFDEVAAEI